ncbi:FAD-dependent oxidoreductase [Leucobacter sp. CSA1]|uniref:FAD-dependent oxidoreductase n=1 Tax=Leucobacter chromiisoli TaxID=2796471 RepID=A0A934Q5Z0_9MICO|nr:FAD-dependent oxidoreductase [Leucobacter chromiisoli]MBK0418995.1 FAD-dependent oxidoreductase [Leucobacter chromiisoli]
MSSLWRLTAAPVRTDPFPAKERWDVVVAGAGLTGLTTAVLLARAGQRVLVLEARDVGSVTTGNTTGKLSLLQGTVLSEIRKHAGDEVLRAYAQANREGQAWLLRELTRRGAPADRRPAYTYAATDAGVPTLEAEFDASAAAGIPARLVEGPADIGLPFPVQGALQLEEQAQLQPMAVLTELAVELRERGGMLVEGCRVLGAEADSVGVDVETTLGPLTAQVCVLATGVPILDRGMFFARLEPTRSYAAAYRLPQTDLPYGMYVSADGPTRSLRTAAGLDGSDVLVVGGGSHVTGRSASTPSALRELDEWTAQNFAGAKRIAWWGAQDYRAHSRVPFAGPVVGSHERIFAATGYNKWGMTNAIAAALTLSADILGGRLDWARKLREHGLGAATLGAAAAANVSVAGRVVSGWASAETQPEGDPGPLAEGEGVVVREGLSPVGVSRVDGVQCRVSGVCTHLGGVLNWNAAERSWDCPLHGSRFSARGELLEGPAVRDLEQR